MVDRERLRRPFAQTLDGLRQHVATGLDFIDERRRRLAGPHASSTRASSMCVASPRFIAPAIRALPLKVWSRRAMACDAVPLAGSAPGTELVGHIPGEIDRFLKEDRQQLFVEFIVQLRQRCCLDHRCRWLDWGFRLRRTAAHRAIE
jgi:hypothetical protein